MRAKFVRDIQKNLKILLNVPCVCAARNNVSALCHGRAPSQDIMLPPQCVLVLPVTNGGNPACFRREQDLQLVHRRKIGGRKCPLSGDRFRLGWQRHDYSHRAHGSAHAQQRQRPDRQHETLAEQSTRAPDRGCAVGNPQDAPGRGQDADRCGGRVRAVLASPPGRWVLASSEAGPQAWNPHMAAAAGSVVRGGQQRYQPVHLRDILWEIQDHFLLMAKGSTNFTRNSNVS